MVGYIAIQDLTKMSDIIRSRTFDAFFPLFATAFIYFVLTYLFIFLMGRVEIRLDPKRRKRVIKGIEVVNRGGSNMITIRDLSKSYGELSVLENISTEINKGEVISIIGPFGCGKSTFLRCINLLEKPTGGQIIIDGNGQVEYLKDAVDGD